MEEDGASQSSLVRGEHECGVDGISRESNVSLVVDQTPADAKQRFTLTDAISLRNSERY